MKPTGMKQTFNSVSIVVVALLSLYQVQLAFAQLNTFEAGQPIRASEMNHNFEVVQEQISEISTSSITDAGCSATQQDNSVLIECSDGTSGVIAGAGTVVVYPQGQVGEAPDITAYPSGDFVVMDANNVVLAKSRDLNGPGFDVRDLWFTIVNNHDSATVDIWPLATTGTVVLFSSEDCMGEPLVPYYDHLLYLENVGFGIAGPRVGEQLIKSKITPKRWGGDSVGVIEQSECEAVNGIQNVSVWINYTPAPEILNAAYPVRLEQLP
jgi:hypothetical protein